MTFETEIKVHFDEADPAGIAFSGGIFTKMHRCYEEFIEALGEDSKKFFLDPELIYPIRHVEVDYLGPLLPLRNYAVAIQVKKISQTSFELQFNVTQAEKLMCQLSSVHVCCELSSMAKQPIPADLKQKLENYLIG